jgi:hypothetical protein
MTPTLMAVFGAAFATTAIYLLLAWRLVVRWNSGGMGAFVRLIDTPAVLRVIWGGASAKQDERFLRLRSATRIAFVLSCVGILAWFIFVFRAASS